MAPNFTVCVAVDARTIQQLEQVFPTWMRFRPGLRDRPWVAICDTTAHKLDWWQGRLGKLKLPNLSRIGWCWGQHLKQRERMLTGFVAVPPLTAQTPYWLKIDTDVVATSDSPWPRPEWFDGEPAIISNAWGYTKPADWPQRLDRWAADIAELKDGPPLDLPPPAPGQETIGHRRMVSWCAFFRTDFTKLCARLMGQRLPVPSEDTFHWYIAQRLGETLCPINMQKHGWATRHSEKGRKKLIEEVMGIMPKGCCG